MEQQVLKNLIRLVYIFLLAIICFPVNAGDFIGENSGHIVDITENAILIEQIVRVNDQWAVKRVQLRKLQ